MRGMARRASASASCRRADRYALPQLAMAEPKQLIVTPSRWSSSHTRSNSASSRSCRFLPPTLRASMNLHPSARVARIWPDKSGARLVREPGQIHEPGPVQALVRPFK